MNEEHETTHPQNPLTAVFLGFVVLLLTCGVVFGYYTFLSTTSTLSTISPTYDF